MINDLIDFVVESKYVKAFFFCACMIIKSESQYIKVLLQGEKLAEIIEIGLIKLPEATTRHKVSKQIKYLLNISKKSDPELSR